MATTAIEFFQRSAGNWKSKRTTHHLPFRRAETGESDIVVESLTANDPKIIEICQLHEIDPRSSVGGAFVRWEASMAWDREERSKSGKITEGERLRRNRTSNRSLSNGLRRRASFSN